MTCPFLRVATKIDPSAEGEKKKRNKRKPNLFPIKLLKSLNPFLFQLVAK